jgi:hypothetical protein
MSYDPLSPEALVVSLGKLTREKTNKQTTNKPTLLLFVFFGCMKARHGHNEPAPTSTHQHTMKDEW